MKKFFLLLGLCACLGVTAQDDIGPDQKYLEDQFYLGITYNLLLNLPSGINQRSFSYGLQGGIIKDIPLNKKRNVGLGIGLGYALNSYYSNLKATQQGADVIYARIPSSEQFKRSKFETQFLELPIEFRWRNSNAFSHKFWRIYGGVKFAYLIGGKSRFVSNTEKTSFQNPDIRKFQTGLILSLGYNTFNIHFHYSLFKLLEDDVATAEGETIEMVPLHIGLIFYIL